MENKDEADLEMDDAADITRGRVHPAAVLWLCRSGWHFIACVDPN